MYVALEHYRIFRAVAHAGSFSGAAAELFITQPAVSQAIGKLEAELGATLFVRSARGAALTPEGELLLSYIDSALGMVESAENRFSELRGLARGSLRIGASDTLCRHFLLPYLSRFHEAYPGIKVKVTNRTSSETVALLAAGKVDLGFVNLPTAVKGDLEVRPLMEVDDCFVAQTGRYPELAGPTPLPALMRYPLLMLEQQSSTRVALDRFFAEKSAELYPQIELGSLDLLLAFAAAGLGIAAVTRQYAEEYLTDGRLRVIETVPALPRRSIGLVLHREIPPSAAARRFVGMIEAGGAEQKTG